MATSFDAVGHTYRVGYRAECDWGRIHQSGCTFGGELRRLVRFFLVSSGRQYCLTCFHFPSLLLVSNKLASIRFGLATPLQPVTFFCHVVVRQLLASIVSYLAILVVSVPLLFILAFSVMFPILNTMEVMPTSIGGIFSQFLPIFIVMGVAGFFLYLTGIYLFLRCSVGLSVTARTGRSLKLGGSFRHCGNAAPQRSIHRASLSLTGLMFLLPIVAYAIGVSPFWLIYPSEMNALLSVNPMVHEQVAQMAQSNGIQIFQAGLTLFTLVALPFCAVLVMIRLSRRIPAEIEPTGS